MFFIGQNSKDVRMAYSFLELLIFFLSTLVLIFFLEFIYHYIKEILYVNTNSNKNQAWNKNKEIFIFTCFTWVKIPYQKFLTFLSFKNIFRSSRLQMFIKIGALKNFATFSIKKCLQHRCFPVNIAKVLRTTF